MLNQSINQSCACNESSRLLRTQGLAAVKLLLLKALCEHEPEHLSVADLIRQGRHSKMR